MGNGLDPNWGKFQETDPNIMQSCGAGAATFRAASEPIFFVGHSRAGAAPAAPLGKQKRKALFLCQT